MNIYTQELQSMIDCTLYNWFRFGPKEFTPAYLYIKQHTITGKMYFGKTIQNPEKYNGSGKHWSNHIKKHGKEHVETIWYCLFHNIYDIVEFSLMFSHQEDISSSELWLNLKPENGVDGTLPGQKFSKEINDKKARIGANNGMYGKTHTLEVCAAQSARAIKKFKGKSYEDLYGVEKSNELKELRRLSSLGKDNSGAKNPRALTIKAISPQGEEFIIIGEIAKFCIEHKLGYSKVADCYIRNKPHFKGWQFTKM